MKKLKPISELSIISRKSKLLGKRVGLITGCFDVLHAGHIDLFTFATKKCDLLIVGLDNDQSIRLSKGKDRPINNFKHRAVILNELNSIDYIFEIKDVFRFHNKNSENIHDKIMLAIRPDFIFTNPQADTFWNEKKKRAIRHGVRLIIRNKRRLNSSSNIVKVIEANL